MEASLGHWPCHTVEKLTPHNSLTVKWIDSIMNVWIDKDSLNVAISEPSSTVNTELKYKH